jgi:hypothetical protein
VAAGRGGRKGSGEWTLAEEEGGGDQEGSRATSATAQQPATGLGGQTSSSRNSSSSSSATIVFTRSHNALLVEFEHPAGSPAPALPASSVARQPPKRTLLRKVPWVFLDDDDDDDDDDEGAEEQKEGHHQDLTVWVGAFAARPDPEDWEVAALGPEMGSLGLEVRFLGLVVETE